MRGTGFYGNGSTIRGARGGARGRRVGQERGGTRQPRTYRGLLYDDNEKTVFGARLKLVACHRTRMAKTRGEGDSPKVSRQLPTRGEILLNGKSEEDK